MLRCAVCGKQELDRGVDDAGVFCGKDRIPVTLSSLDGKLMELVHELRLTQLPVTGGQSLGTVVKCLCASCWQNHSATFVEADNNQLHIVRMSDEERSAGTRLYLGVPAKTTGAGPLGAGVYLNVEHPYLSSAEVILCTLVHELMHYRSYQHAGLQVRDERHGLDECVTEYLAIGTFLRQFPDLSYHTNYGNRAFFLENLATRIDAGLNQAKFFGDAKGFRAAMRRYPPGLADYMESCVTPQGGGKQRPKAGWIEGDFAAFKQRHLDGGARAELLGRMRNALMFYFARSLTFWYFAGPGARCAEAIEWFGEDAGFGQVCQSISDCGGLDIDQKPAVMDKGRKPRDLRELYGLRL